MQVRHKHVKPPVYFFNRQISWLRHVDGHRLFSVWSQALKSPQLCRSCIDKCQQFFLLFVTGGSLKWEEPSAISAVWGKTNDRTRQTPTVTPAGLADAACLRGCLPARAVARECGHSGSAPQWAAQVDRFTPMESLHQHARSPLWIREGSDSPDTPHPPLPTNAAITSQATTS